MRSASRGMTAKFEGLVQNYSGLVVALGGAFSCYLRCWHGNSAKLFDCF
jgi:hypothetical protein